jgi:hypothetical protein
MIAMDTQKHLQMPSEYSNKCPYDILSHQPTKPSPKACVKLLMYNHTPLSRLFKLQKTTDKSWYYKSSM